MSGRGSPRGSPAPGRGRGRGGLGAFKSRDMTTLALDYDQINAPAMPEHISNVSSNAARNGPTPPQGFRQPHLYRTFQKSAPKSLADAQEGRSPSPAGPGSQSQNVPLKHAGIGMRGTAQAIHGNGAPARAAMSHFRSARMPDYSSYAHDPALTKPITFVKAAKGLESTLDPEAKFEYECQKRIQNLATSALTPMPARPIMADQPESSTMAKNASAESAASKSSGSSKALSPHAAPFRQSSFLGDYVPPSPTRKEMSISAEKGKGKAKAVEIPPASAEPGLPAFVIDLEGEKQKGQDIKKIVIPERNVPVPQPSARSVSNGNALPLKIDSDESDTEDVYPVKPPAKAASSMQTKTLAMPSAPVFQPSTKPYATIVTDEDFDLSKFKTVFDPKLSASAKEFVSQATKPNPQDQKAPGRRATKNRLRREAKERKKDRKLNKGKGKVAERQVGHKSYREPKVPRVDDSDLEWGSDGPPLKDDYDEAEAEMMTYEVSQVSLSGKPARTGKGKRGRSALDLAAEDYIANIAAQKDSEEEDVTITGLQSFVRAMKTGEHLTIDDLHDIEQMSSDSEEESESEEDSNSGASRRKKIDEKEEFPVFIPAPAELDSDLDPVNNSLFVSEDENDNDPATMAKWAARGKELMDLIKQDEPSGSSASSVSEEEEEVRQAIEKAIYDVTMSDDEDELIIESDEDDIATRINGDDDSSEEEPPALSRKKKKPATGDADIFDDLLQAQWLKDKQKKAMYKQDRALKRAQQNPTKSNKKKAKRAAGKASAYDLDDDFAVNGDTFEALGGMSVPEFHRINDDLRAFIEFSGHHEYPLPPMDKKFRMAVHMLADAYNLKSKSRGTGKQRHPVLYRTMHTTTEGANMKKIQKWMAITSSWSAGKGKSFTYARPKTGAAAGRPGAGAVSRNHEGAVVGEGADKIASDNIGHQMLAKMGWKEGMMIGKTGGLNEPLKAIVKTSKAGLGSGWVRYNRGTLVADDGGVAVEEVVAQWTT